MMLVRQNSLLPIVGMSVVDGSLIGKTIVDERASYHSNMAVKHDGLEA